MCLQKIQPKKEEKRYKKLKDYQIKVGELRNIPYWYMKDLI